MAIHGVKLKKTSNAQYVVSALTLICCRLGEGDNVAHLFGDEASDIHPAQFIQELPGKTAKILSEICRRGMCFHVAAHGGISGIFIAKNAKTLKQNT
ncbi:TPA: hypothetical protein ACW7QV_003330 [Citrobacter braakii]|uniref:Uncharacterized protein n=1 Tax=Citrobacter braakii TaxID=57706 RepID=A0AAD1L4M3_CITBR|nr:hypothetical protein KAM621c_24410 [Citrobacter braakii]HEE0062721.1 hypothetical protein [Citrobacter braakii]HEE9823230.1 hypothetical protein [Citrobacter braakii]